ncbi:RagB/SusD family nutrient uptake outer membrane protein [Mucilaginibacter aquaedulcis]|uniref:RagB/SusD family nutrient uptake outer membrane protein n=1 Tax=Mucilaginibacter aquaedulcis TaxID=1187081 RepID=UPI0025B3D76A|nr:RagB/SusD family nutrient uptake outer membrane protein [Mucilaginibacter aquaedulcis]MDN3549212.1 RagB/SusD family nutrient uptake outer membrane protein [Mucilaginibacter aquaedulcis]
MKMKKKYLIALFALAIAGTLYSCKKSFLNQIPKNSLIANFSTGADAEAALNGAYSLMANANNHYYDWNYIIDGDVRSDNCYSGGSAPDINGVDQFTSIPTDGQPVTQDYSELYSEINAANILIDNVINIQDATLSDTRKAQIIGEAKFLRGYHYYNLVKNYGPVVLQLHTITVDPDVNKTRSPVADVYAQIEKDLVEAEAALPTAYSTQAESHSRATKGAAEAVLAKMYAQQGKYQQCLDYCNKVLPGTYGGTNSTGYALLANFDWCFDGLHRSNSESIFELQHTQGTITHGYAQGLILSPQLTDQYFTKFVVPSHDIVKAFKAAGDSIRFKSSIYWEYNGPKSANPVPTPYPYGPDDTIPYVWKAGRTWPGSWSGGSSDPITLIRLADIVLLKAEALNALGSTSQALPLVNAIRTRVSLAPISVSSQADMALAILNERRLELAFEGERWFDLLRYGAQYTISLMNAQVDGSGKNLNYNVDPHRLIYPIPQVDLGNNPKLTQNPGY